MTDTLHALGLSPVCTAAKLRGTATLPRTYISGVYTTFTLANTSRLACTLAGYPRLTLLDDDGSPLPTTVTDAGAEYLARGEAVQRLTLAPEQSAFFFATWPRPGRSCQAKEASTVLIGLPHASQPIVVPVGSARHTFSPCGGKLTVGSLEPFGL